MKIQYWFHFLIFCLFASLANAQSIKKHILSFQPRFDKSALSLNDSIYKLTNDDSIQFGKLKFYISGIELLNSNSVVWKEDNSYHLVDASEKNSKNIILKLTHSILFNKIKFYLGIDSITNTSGAMGGDLDPTKGMYWTWQNGYINFKLEGKSNRCKTRNNEFEFHLGGYQYPNNAIQTIILNISSSDQTDIFLDVEKLINKIDLSKVNHIMSPGKEALLISKNASDIFSVISK